MERNANSARYYPVKLCMEVSYTTHSHIIGRGGANINHVMEETSTKIHFPDQNRVIGEKKSNEVTISGELANVETARRRLRFLTPVEFVVDCATEILDAYGRTALIKNFAAAYDVLLRVSEKPTSAQTTSVTLRGSHKELPRLKEAVSYFMKITQKPNSQVAAKMEMGNDCASVIEAHAHLIENQFSVAISLIPFSSSQKEDLRVVWIKGNIDTVYLAKNALTELLPLKLMFHVHSVHLSFGVNERKLAKRLDVAVKMESSTKPSSFLLQISSYEKNAGNMYEFRRQILRLPIPHLNGLTCPPRLQDANDTVMTSSAKLQTPRFRDVNDYTTTSSPPKCANYLPSVIPAQTNPFSEAITNRVPLSSGMLGPSPFSLKFDQVSYMQLCEVLVEANLTEFCELFLANEIDLTMFMTLTDGDLKNIGVSSYPARRIMLQIISDLHSKSVARGFSFYHSDSN